MHLLNAQSGFIEDRTQAVDLDQQPAPIIILSAADSDNALLTQAQHRLKKSSPKAPDLRLANIGQISHPLSVDLYIEKTCAFAKIIIVRLLGGTNYWQYLVDELSALKKTKLVFLPGDHEFDEILADRSTVSREHWQLFFDYFVAGGLQNSIQLLKLAACLSGYSTGYKPPKPLKQAGVYLDGEIIEHFEDIKCPHHNPVFISFYRALVQSNDTETIDHLIKKLRMHKMDPIAFFCHSLKDPKNLNIANYLIKKFKPKLGIATTGFALSKPGINAMPEPWSLIKGPVFQFVMSTQMQQSWKRSTQAMPPRDLAMHIALPEIDGRILIRAIAFKKPTLRDKLTQTSITKMKPQSERIDWSLRLAKNWLKLQNKKEKDRKIAIMLAHYPSKQSRIGNGVGLDTPQSVIHCIQHMRQHGYVIRDFPFKNGDQLIRALSKLPHSA
ncbi:MAG: cobaltochelatase subunit CobN, partial [Pseudomonadota bacterium]